MKELITNKNRTSIREMLLVHAHHA